jgi:uncharacterized membrane protein
MFQSAAHQTFVVQSPGKSASPRKPAPALLRKRDNMKILGKYILTGLITLLPVILTIYLLYWLADSAETLLGGLIPRQIYLPGMGMAAALLVALTVGVLMHTVLIQRLFMRGERIFYRLPLVKSVYSAMRDFMDYFSPTRKREFEQVVSVTMGDTGIRLVGFVTQANPTLLPDALQGDDSVLVYLPMSYMIGGYAVLVPRASIQTLNMSMEEAMRFVLTAGVTGTSTRT